MTTETKETQQMIRRAALILLARREHSCKEIIQKLSHKNFEQDLVQIVVNQLLDENLLSETRFIENYISARQKKGFGPLHIRQALKHRGIPDEQLEKCLILNDSIWFELAEIAWKKRFKNQSPNTLTDRAKQVYFLQNRGFTQDQIERVMNQKQ